MKSSAWLRAVSAPLQSQQIPSWSSHKFPGSWVAGAQGNVVIEGGNVDGLTGQPGAGPCRAVWDQQHPSRVRELGGF